MAPKTSMKQIPSKSPAKTAMKSVIKSVMKAPMKAIAASSSKPADVKAPPASNKMTKKALQSLGKFSLEDKMRKALDDNHGDPAAAADDFKASLTKLEQSKVWGQHQTFLKNNPEQANEIEDSKKGKGMACALWFLQDRGTKFINIAHKVGGQIAIKKIEEWCSEKQMVDRFGQAEFESHCHSGRLLWRECPVTRGTYEYKDQQQMVRETTTYKGKELTRGEEADLSPDVDKMFEDLYQQDHFDMKCFC